MFNAIEEVTVRLRVKEANQNCKWTIESYETGDSLEGSLTITDDQDKGPIILPEHVSNKYIMDSND